MDEDEVPDLEKVTVLLLPEASAALIQGAARLGMSRTDFINVALIKAADLAADGLVARPRWFPWLKVRLRLIPK